MSDVVPFFDALLRYEIGLWNVLDDAIQRTHGLSLGRLQALRVLHEHGGRARVQDLAGELALTVGATSKLVDRLERDGSARRDPNPADRRSSLIALTAPGTRLLAEAAGTFEKVLAERIPPEVVAGGELARTTRTLRALLDHLGSGGRVLGSGKGFAPPDSSGNGPGLSAAWADLLPGSRLRSVTAEEVEVGGRPALRVELLDDITRAGVPDVDYVDMPTFVELPVEFTDGVIEVDILARLNGAWPEGARGFAGVAYHIQPAGPFECVYLRPTNGTRAQAPSPRNERAIQYFAYPDWRFERLRTEQPGVYEAGAPIDIDQWTTLRLEISGSSVRALVAGEPCLTVSPTLLEPTGGRIGLFVDIGTVAYFADLRVQPGNGDGKRSTDA